MASLSAKLFWSLWILVRFKDSKNSIVSHIAFLYFFNLLHLHEKWFLTWSIIKSYSPLIFNILIPLSLYISNPSRSASYYATLVVASNSILKEKLKTCPIGEVMTTPTPFPNLEWAPSKFIFHISSAFSSLNFSLTGAKEVE